MRAERERAHLPDVALAGYTNAGKSTLLNALTGAEVGRARPPVRDPRPDHAHARRRRPSYLLTDTVGFIRKLPHQLVDAFGATLEETRAAPSSSSTWSTPSTDEERMVEMIRAVDEVLEDIGAGSSPRRARPQQGRPDRRRAARGAALSAPRWASWSRRRRGRAWRRCALACGPRFAPTLRSVELLVPVRRRGLLPELHAAAGDLQREETAEGVRVIARLPAALAARLRPLRGQRPRLAGRCRSLAADALALQREGALGPRYKSVAHERRTPAPACTWRSRCG
jgi:GTP-binding protein HflX